jgi:hypothetical protein
MHPLSVARHPVQRSANIFTTLCTFIKKMSFSGRIGRFFFFIGLIGLLVFFATAQANDPVISFFCGGSISLGLGILLMWRGRTPPQPSNRFRLFRKSRKKEGNKDL